MEFLHPPDLAVVHDRFEPHGSPGGALVVLVVLAKAVTENARTATNVVLISIRFKMSSRGSLLRSPMIDEATLL